MFLDQILENKILIIINDQQTKVKIKISIAIVSFVFLASAILRLGK